LTDSVEGVLSTGAGWDWGNNTASIDEIVTGAETSQTVSVGGVESIAIDVD
jgi:hypothetical protein